MTSISFVFLQTTVKDFAARSIGILQEAMRWAPSATRSHLMQYLLQMDHSSRGLYQHSGLALITESVLQHAGYNRSAAALGVNIEDHLSLHLKITSGKFGAPNLHRHCQIPREL